MVQAIPHSLEPYERAARLYEIGLKEQQLREAVFRGYVARSSCTRFHPRIYPGISQWANTHRALREELAPAGWTADDKGNYSTVIRPDGKIAIAVATGDDRTGKPGSPEPRTRYRRGPRTQAAVDVNQLVLFGPSGESRIEAEEPLRRLTYYLLFFVHRNEVRMELSLPSKVDGSGRIHSWSDRMFLEPLAIDLPPDDEDEWPGMDIDVPVEPI